MNDDIYGMKLCPTPLLIIIGAIHQWQQFVVIP